MARLEKNRVKVKTLRKTLGWTQEDFALVLKISRENFNKIENQTRGADAEVIEKIKLIEDSLKHIKTLGLLNPSTQSIWPDDLYTHLKIKAGELEIEILDMEKVIRARRKNAMNKINRNKLLASQIEYLTSVNAPQNMLKALSLLKQSENQLSDYHSPEKVILYESRIAGKRAELSFLKKIIASWSKF